MLSARLTQYYGRLLRPPGTHPLSGLPVIGHAAPATPSAGHRAGEGLSSSRRHHRYVPRPIRRGVLGRLHFQVFRAFRGLRPDGGGSALPFALQTDCWFFTAREIEEAWVGADGRARPERMCENQQVRASRLVMVVIMARWTMASWWSGLAS